MLNESITELLTKETLLLETLVREKQPWRQMDDSMHGWTNVNWLDEITWIEFETRFKKRFFHLTIKKPCSEI
jgi:hypothetical protein